MATFTFILGLSLGLIFCYWQRLQFNKQLKYTLSSSSKTADLEPSLPMTSLVRRELLALNQQCLEIELQAQIQKDLLDRAPIGYLQVDADNQLLWCNQQAIELLKIDRWQPGQIRLLLELVRSYELDQLIQSTRQQNEAQVQSWTFYPSQHSLDRAKLWGSRSIALKGYSYPLPAGQIAVFLENQQPLVQLSQSRERAFSDLTHELRTPLTSISLIAETLEKRLENPEKRWAQQMSKEIARLIKLVQDWLEITHLQANPGQYLNYQSLDLKELIFSAWQSVAPLAVQKEIKILYEEGEKIFLEADKSKLMRVFLNLLDNSVKYSPARGAVEIKVERQDDKAVINLIDYGSGFDEEDLPHVFERLYRGDSARSREEGNEQGSGLGLSIAQQIIQAHGGSIEANNHPETGGAWLTLKIPLRRTI
ncbi:MAG: Sensor protein SphS [Chroococcopsis gigantea SAG 12.99]|jgi:two-component system phosphate regulon sensor histidine kinase PhoR|nr:PAS domain-containing sensor histidine kinase [Chlorogloea purpurea SAG 13.99]MDV3001339.1 Sensor protein SphS [Chroococcopsis gigantea SAG 12.99]